MARLELLCTVSMAKKTPKCRPTIEYMDSTSTSGFTIIDRIRLSHPTGCHCRVFPDNSPPYISSPESL